MGPSWASSVNVLGLTQEERFDGCWLVQQSGSAIKRVFNGLFQAVKAKAPAVRVHHQAERGRSTRIAGDRDRDGAIVLQHQKAASNSDLRRYQHGLPRAGTRIDHLAKSVGGERHARTALIALRAEFGREAPEERTG